jgi:hypothetical protein
MFETSFFTVLSGTAVFVLGQLLLKFVIEPIKELKEVLGEIQFALIYHEQSIHTPSGNRAEEDAAQDAIVDLASRLRAKAEAVPCYHCISKSSKGFIPPKNQVVDASKALIGISHSMHAENRSERNHKRVKTIEKLLGFDLRRSDD